MDSSNNKLVMSEKPNPDPNQHPLKCPRCDSSNTKFCYYNNYSLSQPRHFCKACKRYWTRGGTLRNVPVGGGCRKNKRVKRPQPTGSGDGISSATTSHIQPSNIDLTSSGVSNMSTNMNGSLFYNPIELNFPYPGFSSTRVSLDRSGGAGFDLQSQMNNTSIGGGGGLGFFSGLMANNGAHNHGRSQEFNSGDPACFVGSSASSMASLLVSSLQQPSNGFTGFSQYDNQDLRMARGEQNGGKEVKMEWNNNQIHHGQQINGSDSSSLLWNSNNNNIGSWFDPSNMSSSVPSLI